MTLDEFLDPDISKRHPPKVLIEGVPHSDEDRLKDYFESVSSTEQQADRLLEMVTKKIELATKRCSCADCQMPDYVRKGSGIYFGLVEWHVVDDDENKVQLVFRPYEFDGPIASRTPKTYELVAFNQHREPMTPSDIKEGEYIHAEMIQESDERGSQKFQLKWRESWFSAPRLKAEEFSQ